MLLQPFIGCQEINSGPRFVSQRPSYNTSMIFISLEHPFRTINKDMRPFRSVRQRLPGIITNSMAFNIRLINDIQTIFITQPIPKRIIGIVSRTHTIYIHLFHQANIGQHRFPIHHMSLFRIIFMTIHPFQQNRLSVYQQLPSLNL